MEYFLIGFGLAAVLFCLVLLVLNAQKNQPAALPSNDCPWHQRLRSWAKRHTPLLGVLASALALLFIYRWLVPLVYLANGTSTPLSGQENVDGAQILASQQTGGTKQLGALVSVLLGGTLYFSVLLAGVWWLMSFITPGLPPWAKKYFTLGFKNVGDEGYNMGASLGVRTQFRYYLCTWFGLLGLWAACLLVAALSQ